MRDIVLIEGLVVSATIGIYEWEQRIKQTLVLDLTLEWDSRKAAKTDDVSYCLNYAAVTDTVVEFIEARQFFLIERVAEEISSLIMSRFSVPKVTIKVSKPGAVSKASNVAVLMTRQRSCMDWGWFPFFKNNKSGSNN